MAADACPSCRRLCYSRIYTRTSANHVCRVLSAARFEISSFRVGKAKGTAVEFTVVGFRFWGLGRWACLAAFPVFLCGVLTTSPRAVIHWGTGRELQARKAPRFRV